MKTYTSKYLKSTITFSRERILWGYLHQSKSLNINDRHIESA